MNLMSEMQVAKNRMNKKVNCKHQFAKQRAAKGQIQKGKRRGKDKKSKKDNKLLRGKGKMAQDSFSYFCLKLLLTSFIL